MLDFIERLKDRPAVARVMAVFERYNSRLGPAFAAGITYFSVLSMVPILMFSFAALGMTLTVLRPDLMSTVQQQITSALADETISDLVGELVTQAFSQWATVGLAALITAAYSGSKWVGHLKRAVRVMWATDFESGAGKKNFFVELLINLLIFIGLLVCIVFSIGMATIGSTFSRDVIEWLSWESIPGIGVFFTLLTIGLSFVASWILMAFLFMVLPNQPARPRPWLVGTLLGAVALTVVQRIAGFLVSLFTPEDGEGKLTSAAFFGPVIVLMLLFNIIASCILISASWVGSADEWRVALRERLQERAAQERAVKLLAEGVAADSEPGPEADGPALRLGLAFGPRGRALPTGDLGGADPVPAAHDAAPQVRQSVAERGMRINLGLGYTVGTATGLGLGALTVSIVNKLRRR